jgi:methylglyoxal reductase
MNLREIGKSGIFASTIGLGTWAIGGGTWWGETDDNLSIKAIQEAIDQGINLIDTAPGYGFGHSEEIVGKAIKGKRDKVILSTKCGLWWHDDRGSDFFELDGFKVKRSLDPETIRMEIEYSLKRLGTDYIDIYHTHWPAVEPYKTPIEDTMECLLKLKKEGKIRSIGVSNVDVESMREYMKTGIIDVNQAKYSMLDRGIEESVVPYCQQNSISILAYSPLEQGLLTGKIGMDKTFSEGEYRNSIPWFRPENRIKVLQMLNNWKVLTEKYNCSLSQLVIAWTYSQPGITHVLCGAKKPEQVIENAKAYTVDLNEEDLITMRSDVMKLTIEE